MTAETPLCIVPARGISPGLAKKNLKEINQRPLVSYTVESAIESDCFDEVYVSTESDAIAEVSREYGARPVQTTSKIE